MASRALQWHRLAADPDLLPWNDRQLAETSINGKRICVARHEGKFHAFAATCPHAGGHFSEGWIDTLGNIVCPLHRYRFALANGRNTSGEGYYLKTYPLEHRTDGLFIGLPEPGLFGR
jgi:3-phenylpropionate/trans-cinnamate dioxygenase ferredoxin subunit